MNQTELSNFLDEVLDELQYRIDEGLINLNNPTHKSILSEILTEQGQSHLLNPIVSSQLLTEADPKTKDKPSSPNDDDYSHLGNGIYVKKGNEEKPTAPKFKKDEQGNYKAMSAAKAGDIKQKAGEDGGSNNNPQAKTDDGSKPADAQSADSGGIGEEEPETGTALKDPMYQRYVKDLDLSTSGEQEEDVPYGGVYSLGGGYYSTTKNGPPEYKKVEEAITVNVKGGGMATVNPITNEEIHNINNQSLNSFIVDGYTDSDAAPGRAGSMLNEILSVLHGTDFLNQGKEFDYTESITMMVKKLKNSKLGKENESSTPAGRITTKEARIFANQYDISIGLASKIMIATKAARKKHNRIKKTIIDKNGLLDFKAIPLFGDTNGLRTQEMLVNNTKGEIKLGNTIIPKEEALKIIKNSGGGDNPSDTAIFVMDNKTGDLYLSFFSDKDATNAILSQSTIAKETEMKIKSMQNLVEENLLSSDEQKYYTSIIQTTLENYKKIEDTLSDTVSAPVKHLETQNIIELINIAKTISKGANPNVYWDEIKKKMQTKKYQHFLPEKTVDYVTDNDIMHAFIKYANSTVVQGTLTKHEQRVVMDLSDATNGPNPATAIAKIRQETVQTDLSLIRKLDEKKINLNGMEVGLGTYLEAIQVTEKLHLDMLFGGTGVYQDQDGFAQENGGVTITKDTLEQCLPFKTKADLVSHFEVGEERDQIKRGGDEVTGVSKIIYIVTKDGKKYPIGEKKQRTKQGTLSRLNTVYNFHPDLQKCLDAHGK
jgi:hypothetical protein